MAICFVCLFRVRMCPLSLAQFSQFADADASRATATVMTSPSPLQLRCQFSYRNLRIRNGYSLITNKFVGLVLNFFHYWLGRSVVVVVSPRIKFYVCHAWDADAGRSQITFRVVIIFLSR